MTKFTTAIATAATALLLTGNAFAQMPAAGEGPLFLNEAHAVSPVSREAVRAEAAQKAHAALAWAGRSSLGGLLHWANAVSRLRHAKPKPRRVQYQK